ATPQGGGKGAGVCAPPGRAPDVAWLGGHTPGAPAARRGRGKRAPPPPPAAAPPAPPLPAADAATLERELRQAEHLVVFCWAPWGAADRQMMPVVQRVAVALPAVKFVTIDLQDNVEAAARLTIQAMPTLVPFRQG